MLMGGRLDKLSSVKEDRLREILSQAVVFCANMGCFEQVRPLVDAYRYLDPDGDGPLIGEAYALMAADKSEAAVRLLYKQLMHRSEIGIAHSFLGMALILAKFNKRASELLRLVAQSEDSAAAAMAKALISEYLERPVQASPYGFLS